ncbi:MAG: hypothetical protein AUK16_02975 [Parcubacteria group bacterium CG2_30_44_11]|nr:MAG: hypothetical protein AUK16_02975 [Parcubacteria group bacterium CG2_30_44_11]
MKKEDAIRKVEEKRKSDAAYAARLVYEKSPSPENLETWWKAEKVCSIEVNRNFGDYDIEHLLALGDVFVKYLTKMSDARHKRNGVHKPRTIPVLTLVVSQVA